MFPHIPGIAVERVFRTMDLDIATSGNPSAALPSRVIFASEVPGFILDFLTLQKLPNASLVRPNRLGNLGQVMSRFSNHSQNGFSVNDNGAEIVWRWHIQILRPERLPCNL